MEVDEEDELDDEVEDDDRLEDDDYDLIEENLGIKLKRNKFKRLKRIIDSDSEDEIRKETVATRTGPRFRRAESIMRSSSDSDSNSNSKASESEDDFIVNDYNEPIRQKHSNIPSHTQANLQEAREVFGVDFDYGDIDIVNSRSEDDSDSDQVTRRAEGKKVNLRRRKEIYEPAVLEEAGITDEAEKIRTTDLPERYQHLSLILKPTGSELNDEVIWIYKKAFADREQKKGNELLGDLPSAGAMTAATVVENWDDDDEQADLVVEEIDAPVDTPSIIRNRILRKIKKVIKLIRDEHFEVPYIYFYQKEITRPDLSCYDLWRIFDLSQEYCRFLEKKRRLILLFMSMQSYQMSLGEEVLDRDNIRPISNKEINSLSNATDLVQIQDLQLQFLLYYSEEVPKMKDLMEVKRKELEAHMGEIEDEKGNESNNKNRIRRTFLTSAGSYKLCRRNGIDKMLPLVGFIAEEFGNNFENNVALHSTHQCELELEEVLTHFTSTRMPEPSTVGDAVVFMMAMQISRDPKVRRAVRSTFVAKAKINVAPTKKGFLEIDENHPVFPMKYLKDKPVHGMDGIDFLNLTTAEKDGLITITIGEYISDRKGLGISLVEEAKNLCKAESDALKMEKGPDISKWEDLRGRIMEHAFEKILYVEFGKEIRQELLDKAKKIIIQRCSDKMYTYLKDGAFKVTYPNDPEGEWDTSLGIRVMGLALSEDVPVNACVLNENGYVMDQMIVSDLFSRNIRGLKENSIQSKEDDMIKLRKFIERNKPHVIVVGGESRGATHLVDEIKMILSTFPDDGNECFIPVHIIDNDIAKVYSRTSISREEFPGTTELFRQAVSLARTLQDPLLEISQLWNRDEDILSLHFNKLQKQIGKHELLRAIELEFINRTCEVGVDINQALSHNHRSNTLQFVAGLGVHKATALRRRLRNLGKKLENRSQLITDFGMGSIVFNNCAGFIKILKENLLEDADIDPRDQTRIHPQYYEHLQSVVQVTLREDDPNEELPVVEAVEKVLTESKYQDELRNLVETLVIENYVRNLEESGHGDLTYLFQDIITELLSPYADSRKSFEIPKGEELFYILTKETCETIRVAKLITGYVFDAKWRRPTDQEYDEAMPMQDEKSGKFICKFCLRSDFSEIGEIWQHYDDRSGSCPGIIDGIQIRFGNGITGIIKSHNFSDNPIDQQELQNFVKLRRAINVRILKIDQEHFFLDCTSRTSDLQNPEVMPMKDMYYDDEAEQAEINKLRYRTLKKQLAICPFVKRNIDHPSFKNITYKEAEALLQTMDQGDVIFRPSSKGVNQLSLTWNVVTGIYQHMNINETGKSNDQALGTKLSIGEYDYEDLDEITARFVIPQASLAREISRFRYYKLEDFEDQERATEFLMKEQKANSEKIHYIVSASRKFPGRFIISFLPQSNLHQECMMLSPEGIRYRNFCFPSITECMEYFKKTYPTIN